MTYDTQAVIGRFNPRILGSGTRTVVLAHGIGTDQRAWSHQANALSQAGYRVVLFDFAGATPDTAQFFSPLHHKTLYGFAEDLLVLLYGMGITRATYVGHSMGGMIGVLAAVGEPDLFDSLYLLGSSARYVDDPAAGYTGGFSMETVENLLREAADNFSSWANGFAHLMVGEANSHLSTADFSRGLLGLRPDIVHATLSAALLSDHRTEVDNLRTPLTVLQTRQDFAVPLAAAQWLATHGRARELIEIPTHGHMPHITAPDAVTQALLSGLAEP